MIRSLILLSIFTITVQPSLAQSPSDKGMNRG